jgi:hypothetical protein
MPEELIPATVVVMVALVVLVAEHPVGRGVIAEQAVKVVLTAGQSALVTLLLG